MCVAVTAKRRRKQLRQDAKSRRNAIAARSGTFRDPDKKKATKKK